MFVANCFHMVLVSIKLKVQSSVLWTSSAASKYKVVIYFQGSYVFYN